MNRPPVYAVDDAHGTRLTTGLHDSVARDTAQRMANERGEPVTLYAVTEIEHSEAIEPELDEVCRIHKFKITTATVGKNLGTIGVARLRCQRIETDTYPLGHTTSARQEALRLAVAAGWCKR